MSADFPPLDDPTQEAVSLFWTNRSNQMARLADGGLAGGAARAGGHMVGVEALVATIFAEEMPEATISASSTVLPGYYRATKNWDLGVIYKDVLVAAVEFKSQVGSVGKNINNRVEEAVGNSADLWAAQARNQPFGAVPPWLGYVLILQETPCTESPLNNRSTLFPVDPAFEGASYSQRYQVMLGRFISENLYQAGWFITTKVADDGSVSYNEPLATATGRSFRAAVRGRVQYVRSVLD